MADDRLRKLRDTVLQGSDPRERLEAAKKLQELGAGDVFQKNENDNLARKIAWEIKKLLSAD
jgi:hypothetical protein